MYTSFLGSAVLQLGGGANRVSPPPPLAYFGPLLDFLNEIQEWSSGELMLIAEERVNEIRQKGMKNSQKKII